MLPAVTLREMSFASTPVVVASPLMKASRLGAKEEMVSSRVKSTETTIL